MPVERRNSKTDNEAYASHPDIIDHHSNDEHFGYTTLEDRFRNGVYTQETLLVDGEIVSQASTKGTRLSGFNFALGKDYRQNSSKMVLLNNNTQVLPDMTIAVGSQNPAKLDAVTRAVNRLFRDTCNTIRVVGFDVSSGVSNQPMSDNESIEGAITRARNALKCNLDAQYGIGLEGGVQKIGSHWFESGWIAVVDRSGKIGLGSSAKMELSEKIMERVLNDHEELAVIIDDLSAGFDVRSKEGAMGILTNGALTRAEAYSQGIMFAFSPFVSDDKYWN